MIDRLYHKKKGTVWFGCPSDFYALSGLVRLWQMSGFCSFKGLESIVLLRML